jgi:gonadoliberin III-related protein
MLKKLLSVRAVLTFLLFLSVAFAAWSVYYKVTVWGFSVKPRQISDIWTIEAHVSFMADGEPVKVLLSVPTENREFKIFSEDVVAEGYKTKYLGGDPKKLQLTSGPREGQQNIYYRVLMFDNIDTKGRIRSQAPKKPEAPLMDDQRTAVAKEILEAAGKQTGDWPEKVIKTFRQTPPDPTVVSFLPMKKTPKAVAEAVRTILALKGVPTRLAYGVKLQENKKALSPDLMLEAYISGKWKIYSLKNGKQGLPSDFVIFQRGGDSLLDVEGGEDSSVKFSVLKSVSTSYKLAEKRAELADQKSWYDYSIYSLPLSEQNTLKWLSIFPLAILIVVVLRNVVGLSTMGTFTPMLIAMSLIETGLLAGVACFALILTIGMLIRAWLSRLNLLLVPRISAVVIFVILIMQILTIVGYRMDLKIALSAVFFPIIIMAWIIERASIIWEEDGATDALKQIFFSLVVAILTYFVIDNEEIRHVLFAFNEINLVILLLVMLLGTYTGYRLTELRRFAPLVKDKK